MLYLKTCNNLVYVDFTKKDFCDFVYKYGKHNVNKITLFINELEPTCLYWLNRIAKMEKYDNLKFILATAGYYKPYLDFIRAILEQFPKLNKRTQIQGGVYNLAHGGKYYHFYKNSYCLEVTIHGRGFGAYTTYSRNEYIYCDMFYDNGAAIYGPDCLYENRKEKYDFISRLAIANTGSMRHPVTKEESRALYDIYIKHLLYTFNDIKGKKGKLPDGTIVDMAELYVSPPIQNKNTIGNLTSIQIIKGSDIKHASSSCEAMHMDAD